MTRLANWRWVFIGAGLAALLVTACSVTFGDEDRGPRPWATATPAPMLSTNPPSGALLRPAPAATPVPSTAGQGGALTTEAQLAAVAAPTRDLRDLAQRYRPEVGDIPLVVNAATPHYDIGDRIEFWVHDLSANQDFSITAELVHKTNVAYAWVEVDQPTDVEVIRNGVDNFSRQTYPAATAYFGNEWKPGVDNDPRLHILHATGLGAGIAGYYSSADEYSRLAQSYSNEKEMFYINLSWLNNTRDYTYYETVLAHEFQHMIHWYRDRNEETWVNEGLSEYAQIVAGYDENSGFTLDFAAAPDTQLTMWGEEQGDNATHYGASFLFTAYFAQRFGADLTRALVAHPANGIAGYDAVLAGAGAGYTFDDVFADWLVANYADDPYALALDGVYGYRDLDQDAPRLDERHRVYPTVARKTTVANYGADYIMLEGRGDLTVYFTGATATELADLTPHSGEMLWWGLRGDDINTRLTRRFDLSGIAASAPITMSAALWWKIEDSYDFGYVAASRDGRTWRVLPGPSTTRGVNVDNALGPGYTGDSGGWQVETFDLSDYAGGPVWLRFEYVTDDAVNTQGWFVDDVAIPALRYSADFEQGADGWESEGWLLTDNRLTQRWLVQLLTLEDRRLTEVARIPVDADGRAVFTVPGVGRGRTAVVIVSGLAPFTTEPAAYEYWIDQR
jgi:hypothetical protein